MQAGFEALTKHKSFDSARQRFPQSCPQGESTPVDKGFRPHNGDFAIVPC
jgi:hypothetical protein